ncbi:MAG TPA: sugar-binding protein, partial [Candidatus Methylacidiphilales bacterium]|nr:sugar-binding protein [Candidatus Methylacidiphilales bacterium]
YRNYVENTAILPFIVGSQWFTYPDQPLTGRSFEGFNGEGGNTGLINVADRFYTDFITEAKKTNDEIYQVVLGLRPPFQFQDPRFAARAGSAPKMLSIPRALPAMKLDGTSQNWPGRPPERISPGNLTQGTPDPEFSTSFRLCWDDANLYILAEVKDKTPMLNSLNGSTMWRGDCLELFIGQEKPGESGPPLPSDRHILLSAAEEPKAFAATQATQPLGIRIVTAKNLSGDGYVIEAALPWTDLGIKPEPGKELLFNLGIDNSDDGSQRTRQWMWDGTERASKDRGVWGRAKLQMN